MMADTALNVQMDSGKAERACAWCGADISHMHCNAVNCSADCREAKKQFNRSGKMRHWSKSKYGPRPVAICPECNSRFEQRDPRQIFCIRNGSCQQKAWRRTDHARAYFSCPDVKDRQRIASRKHSETPHGRAAQKERDARLHNVERRKEWSQSEHGRQVKAEYQRRRAAQSALSAILLPVQAHPEVNQ